MSTEQSRLYDFETDSASSIPISSAKVDAELDQMITALNKKVIIKSSAPATADGVTWVDISTDPPTLKMYDQTNTAWLSVISIASPSQGEILYFNGTSWVALGVGTDGQVLKTKGAGQNPVWGNEMPAGVYVPYGGTTAPAGWLMCYGQAVSRTTYSDLFSAISDTFGVGDGSTTFNVPDMRGRVPVGKDNMGGSSANVVTASEADTLGAAFGAETHTLTTDEIPAHTHTIATQTTTNGGGSGDIYHSASSTTGNKSTGSTGGGSAHNNTQPSRTSNFIIKT